MKNDLGRFHVDVVETIEIHAGIDVRGRAELPKETASCGSTTGSTARPLTGPEMSDLALAHVAGEVSEGRLRDILSQTNGLTGDQVRALWFDAIERGLALARRLPSGSNWADRDPTSELPGSSK